VVRGVPVDRGQQRYVVVTTPEERHNDFTAALDYLAQDAAVDPPRGARPR
jgi:hypothetical protein